MDVVDVVLAFPITAEGKAAPVTDARIFAFLPVASFGFRYVLGLPTSKGLVYWYSTYVYMARSVLGMECANPTLPLLLHYTFHDMQ